MNWAYNLLVSLDQLFNTIAGGNPDTTISGHVGYMATLDARWKWVEKVIDHTFAPLEINHCENTCLSDDDIDRTDNRWATAIIAVIGCVVLYVPIRILRGYYEMVNRKI